MPGTPMTPRRLQGLMVALCCLATSGCLGTPANVEPIANFELDSYLGTWHEIARLDHKFERDLEQVTATYTLRDDGSVNVLNRGWNKRTKQWEQAQGRAYLVGGANIGHLKVSFFGPFFASYVIFEKDPSSTDYAFVSGPNHNYLWLLSRTPTINAELMQQFLEQAWKRGFATEDLIWLSTPAITNEQGTTRQ
ncbi:MAG: lipocalin family protein [Pseudomonadales bacterium]